MSITAEQIVKFTELYSITNEEFDYQHYTAKLGEFFKVTPEIKSIVNPKNVSNNFNITTFTYGDKIYSIKVESFNKIDYKQVIELLVTNGFKEVSIPDLRTIFMQVYGSKLTNKLVIYPYMERTYKSKCRNTKTKYYTIG